MKSLDQVVPQGKWTFDVDVTQVFDDMLARSIPQYETMRQTVFELARHFMQDNTPVLDLGCSRGGAIAPLINPSNRFIGIEISPPMIDAARQRFASLDNVEILEMDLRTDYPDCQASVTLCVLTLQFTPIEYRQRILKTIYDHVLPSGVLILVEKIIGSTASIDSLMVEKYYKLKAQNGYSQEQIERKRLSLEGVLVPVTAKWNEELLQIAGFREIDCFWRWLNFAGWLAIK